MPERRLATALLTLLLLAGGLAAGTPKEPDQHFGLIFGTAYGPDDRALYGVKVEIRPAGKKHPSWGLVSDHRGEFAQRVPPGPGDYVITGEAEIIAPQTHKKKRLKGEVKVHIEAEERQDVSLHLSE
ncbi:MAG TPA: hypothetical protein VE825_07305 [Terriglobales bacterium]|jgi:hypothetical protein|nr:hypothetical protein [Terriglobales bacterium]